MTTILLLITVVILLCVAANRFADRTGMPVLLLFIGLGMFFGADGPLQGMWSWCMMFEKQKIKSDTSN